jgi:hypothetical protein
MLKKNYLQFIAIKKSVHGNETTCDKRKRGGYCSGRAGCPKLSHGQFPKRRQPFQKAAFPFSIAKVG